MQALGVLKDAAAVSALKAAAGDGRLTPESVLSLTPARMRAQGLSRQKIAYIRDISRHTRSGEADFDALRRMARVISEQSLCLLTGDRSRIGRPR